MTTAKRKPAKAKVPTSPFAFDYEEFADWYDWIVAARLEPARATFVRLINEWLDAQLNDLDRHRIRVASSSIKGLGRLWTKMQKEKHRANITDLNSIPATIDDLVGIRLTCHNNSDMQTLRTLIAGLPASEEDNEWLCALPDTEKRYVDSPKPTGYRAYHINLRTLLQTPDGWVPAVGELQARTLLQDGWGELTHEDTYKPGVELPPLATKLARRMADLLAAVDDIAQDLRDELDRLAVESVQEAVQVGDQAVEAGRRGHVETFTRATQEAILAETKRIIDSLTKPAPLAEIAQLVQASFGTEISNGWGGFGTFAQLVGKAAPGATVQRTPPGLVIPAGFRFASLPAASSHSTDGAFVPDIVRKLHAYDKNVPLVDSVRINALLDAISQCLQQSVWSELGIRPDSLGIREINVLSKWARDASTVEGELVGRTPLDYFLKMLLFTGNLVPDLPRESVASLVASGVFTRASKLGLVDTPEADRAELRQWFGVTA